jgi:hypothetical protein
MIRTPNVASYEHLISLKKFDTSMDRLMNRLYAIVGETRKNLSVPVLVGIEVDYNGQDNALPVLRTFLHRLRRLHHQHFVRFVTDTLWAMESDNGHLFYTHDGPKNHRCDIMWYVKVLNDEQVEVWVSKSGNPEKDVLLMETSIKLKRFVSSNGRDISDEALVNLLHRFYGRFSQLRAIRSLEEDFHVLLLPSFNNKGYGSVPLYGMSYFDAQRKFKHLIQQMEYTERCYYDTLPDQVSVHDKFWTTLKLIQDNRNFAAARQTVQDTYNLTEMLFAIYAGAMMTRHSSHDVILFHERDEHHQTIDSYRSSMMNLEENLSC